MSGTPEFAEDELRIFSLLKENGFNAPVIYDIGAAHGVWSALVSTVFPQASYHLFEPLAEIRKDYRPQLEFQMKHHPEFVLHPIALGAAEMDIEMRVHADGYSSTILDMAGHPEYTELMTVPQFTLDGYVAARNLPLPDLIKIDTQGAERLILSHGTECLRHASLVFAETWLTRGYGPATPLLTELMDLLSASDFRLADIGHRFYNADHELYGCDAFFLKTDLLRRTAASMPKYAW